MSQETEHAPTPTPGPPSAVPMSSTAIEEHSIDWVPHEERHGHVSSLGNIWFVSNVNLTTMSTGVVVATIGPNLLWTLVAIVLGAVIGTLFMAFHSAQGPQLGLPQLVQSRAQFGYFGATVTVVVAALLLYFAFNVFDAILVGSVGDELLGASPSIGYLLSVVIAAIVAVFGYRQLHLAAKWLVIPSIIALTVLLVGAIVGGGFGQGAFAVDGFELAPFMTVFVILTGFQLGWAPYVSDYSRYLPATVGVRETFLWTYLPSVGAAIWVIAIGALAAAASPDGTPVAVAQAAGDHIVDGAGTACVILLSLGLLTIMAFNAYGGSLALVSAVQSVRAIKLGRVWRIAAIMIFTATTWVTAQFIGADRFNEFYGNVLIFLAYILAPWTAINLTDYFFVRRGRYSITEIFKPDGMYGWWGWRGIGAYLAALLLMVPFVVTTPYTGPLAQELNSVDYAIFIGLLSSALIYYLLTRSLDLEREMRQIEEDERRGANVRAG